MHVFVRLDEINAFSIILYAFRYGICQKTCYKSHQPTIEKCYDFGQWLTTLVCVSNPLIILSMFFLMHTTFVLLPMGYYIATYYCIMIH